MNENQLSARLVRVTDFIPVGARFADIGSDHAYLPSYVCLRDESARAIAGEVNDGPFQLARKQIQRVGLAERVDVRKGNGLDVIIRGEVDVITIAGMGGALISSILEAGKEKLEGVTKLILQPNVAAQTIRVWLRENGWRLVDEDMIEEDDKIYEILVAVPGSDNDLYEQQLEQKLLLGPYLLERKSTIFQKKWKHELQNWQRILLALEEASVSEENTIRTRQLQQKVLLVQEVL